MKFQNVKGTRDFYPQDMAARNWIVRHWRAISQRNGFQEYDGPTFEYLDLYTTKSGDEIVNQLYSFEDRGGRRLALRPEMTPTLARMIAARAQTLPKPIKWFSVPNFFRAERPQRGRLREFLQWNVDIVGTDAEANNVADAECIFVALDFLTPHTLADGERADLFNPSDIEMRISSRELLAQILTHIGIPPQQHAAVYATLDKKAKLAPEAVAEELSKLGLSTAQQDGITRLGEARGEAGLALVEELLGAAQPPDAPLGKVRAVLGLLETMKVGQYCVFDMSVVRGLAYYTGIVFEAYSTGSLRRAICGGGRYGNLLAELGGGQLSGVGFGMGDVIVLDLLEELGRCPEVRPRLECFVVNDGMEHIANAMAAVSAIRIGANTSCNFSYKRTSLKKQMQAAAAHEPEFVLIVGDTLTLKHMRSGKQVTLLARDLSNQEAGDRFVEEYEQGRARLQGQV